MLLYSKLMLHLCRDRTKRRYKRTEDLQTQLSLLKYLQSY